MADGNALIAALRSATPSEMVKAPGAPTTFEAPWTNVSRQPLSAVLSPETPFVPVESWRDTAGLEPAFSGYTAPGYSPPEGFVPDPVVVAPPAPTPPPTSPAPGIQQYESVGPDFWDNLNAEYADEYASFGGTDEEWVNSDRFRNYQSRVLGGIQRTYDTDKLEGDIAFFETQLDDPIYGPNARMLRDAEQAQLNRVRQLQSGAYPDFDINFYGM